MVSNYGEYERNPNTFDKTMIGPSDVDETQTRAAENKHPCGKDKTDFEIGMSFYSGRSDEEVDWDKALFYFNLAWHNDHNYTAALYIGMIYDARDDRKEARKWYIHAIQFGSKIARTRLAELDDKNIEYQSFSPHMPNFKRFKIDEDKEDEIYVMTDEGPKLIYPEPHEHIINYKYDEDRIMNDIQNYVDSTYISDDNNHYAKSKFETTEVLIDHGLGAAFCIGNVVKYAQRYGKKNGFNRQDLMKVIHYTMMVLYVHDNDVESERDCYIQADKRQG